MDLWTDKNRIGRISRKKIQYFRHHGFQSQRNGNKYTKKRHKNCFPMAFLEKRDLDSQI